MPKYERHKTRYPGVYYIIGKSTTNGKNEHIFYISYRKQGKLIEEKAGYKFKDDMTAAKASYIRADKIHGKLQSNRQQRQTDNSNIEYTFDMLWNDYKQSKWYLKRLDNESSIYNNHLKSDIGHKHPSDITTKEIDIIRKRLSSNYKPRTIEYVLAMIIRLTNHGVKRNLCTPLKIIIELPKYDNTTIEDLSAEQLNRLMQVLESESDQNVANLMRLALYSGMRKSEMIKLKWEDVDFERNFIRIRNAKGVKTNTIPMNQLAQKVFINQKRNNNTDYVFPNASGSQRNTGAFKVQLRRIKEKAELPQDFRPLHGLRHVYASMLASSGQVDMYTLQKLLTHKSPQMTQRYAHLRDDALKRASSVVDDIMTDIADGKNIDTKQNQ